MKKIAVFVVLAYLAIFVVLTMPLIVLSFVGEISNFKECFEIYTWPGYWVLIGILLVCEAGLLLLPMRIQHRRPVARRHVLLPIVVSGLLTGILFVGMIISLIEFIYQEQSLGSDWMGYSALAGGILVWLAWGIVFYRLSKNGEPKSTALLLCRRLLQGGVIALLVAVPTHIVARCRDYCCAGFYTFIGITFGIAVMLISFGPGIYFLYAERWRKLHPSARSLDEGNGHQHG